MTWTGARATGWVTIGVVAVGMLAACGQGSSPAGDPSTSGAGTATATVAPTPGSTGTAAASPGATGTAEPPPFPADTAADTAEPSAGAALTVSDVTVATHEGYDRVVLTLGGAGAPGWRVEYVAAPVDDPSGQPLAVAGAAYLQVLIDGTGYPYDTGVAEWAGSPLQPSGLPQVREVNLRGVFEGQTQAFVGLDHTAPFRVFALTDPARLVIDVQH
ncbi:MAG: hypothetical protein KJ792_12685 [Actinobacteria bacterium]|nr:hypothetical protein [Actinomycetota bacterium]MCG2800591.1 hypothetical protein [Cellulomonas sp.]